MLQTTIQPQQIDVHWLWLNSGLAKTRIQAALSTLADGQTLKMAVNFNALKSICDTVANSGWQVLRVELMKNEPGCFVSVMKAQAEPLGEAPVVRDESFAMAV